MSGQLQKDGLKGPLPDVWDLAFKAALGLAKGAAVDELFNNYQSALKAYSKVCSLHVTSGVNKFMLCGHKA